MAEKNKNPQRRDASIVRMDKMEDAILKAVKTVNKPGTEMELTVFELVSVLTKVAHNFNKRGLEFQYTSAEQPAEGVRQLNNGPQGQA